MYDVGRTSTIYYIVDVLMNVQNKSNARYLYSWGCLNCPHIIHDPWFEASYISGRGAHSQVLVYCLLDPPEDNCHQDTFYLALAVASVYIVRVTNVTRLDLCPRYSRVLHYIILNNNGSVACPTALFALFAFRVSFIVVVWMLGRCIDIHYIK